MQFLQQSSDHHIEMDIQEQASTKSFNQNWYFIKELAKTCVSFGLPSQQTTECKQART